MAKTMPGSIEYVTPSGVVVGLLNGGASAVGSDTWPFFREDELPSYDLLSKQEKETFKKSCELYATREGISVRRIPSGARWGVDSSPSPGQLPSRALDCVYYSEDGEVGAVAVRTSKGDQNGTQTLIVELGVKVPEEVALRLNNRHSTFLARMDAPGEYTYFKRFCTLTVPSPNLPNSEHVFPSNIAAIADIVNTAAIVHSANKSALVMHAGSSAGLKEAGVTQVGVPDENGRFDSSRLEKFEVNCDNVVDVCNTIRLRRGVYDMLGGSSVPTRAVFPSPVKLFNAVAVQAAREDIAAMARFFDFSALAGVEGEWEQSGKNIDTVPGVGPYVPLAAPFEGVRRDKFSLPLVEKVVKLSSLEGVAPCELNYADATVAYTMLLAYVTGKGSEQDFVAIAQSLSKLLSAYSSGWDKEKSFFADNIDGGVVKAVLLMFRSDYSPRGNTWTWPNRLNFPRLKGKSLYGDFAEALFTSPHESEDNTPLNAYVRERGISAPPSTMDDTESAVSDDSTSLPEGTDVTLSCTFSGEKVEIESYNTFEGWLSLATQNSSLSFKGDEWQRFSKVAEYITDFFSAQFGEKGFEELGFVTKGGDAAVPGIRHSTVSTKVGIISLTARILETLGEELKRERPTAGEFRVYSSFLYMLTGVDPIRNLAGRDGASKKPLMRNVYTEEMLNFFAGHNAVQAKDGLMIEYHPKKDAIRSILFEGGVTKEEKELYHSYVQAAFNVFSDGEIFAARVLAGKLRELGDSAVASFNPRTGEITHDSPFTPEQVLLYILAGNEHAFDGVKKEDGYDVELSRYRKISEMIHAGLTTARAQKQGTPPPKGGKVYSDDPIFKTNKTGASSRVAFNFPGFIMAGNILLFCRDSGVDMGEELLAALAGVLYLKVEGANADFLEYEKNRALAAFNSLGFFILGDVLSALSPSARGEAREHTIYTPHGGDNARTVRSVITADNVNTVLSTLPPLATMCALSLQRIEDMVRAGDTYFYHPDWNSKCIEYLTSVVVGELVGNENMFDSIVNTDVPVNILSTVVLGPHEAQIIDNPDAVTAYYKAMS